MESNGPRLYSEVAFAPDDYLVFGRETAGLPKQLLEENRERWLRLPMFNAASRSLNLSNCAAIVLFEALRQQGFRGGNLTGRRAARHAFAPAFFNSSATSVCSLVVA